MADAEYDNVIKELYKEHPIDMMVKFNELDIQEKLKDNTYLVVKYRDLFNKEKNDLDKIGALRDKMIGEQYDYYRFNYNKELKPAEIERYYLPKDDKIIKINKIFRQQEWRVKFFETCWTSLGQQAWRMKNFLDADKGM